MKTFATARILVYPFWVRWGGMAALFVITIALLVLAQVISTGVNFLILQAWPALHSVISGWVQFAFGIGSLVVAISLCTSFNRFLVRFGRLPPDANVDEWTIELEDQAFILTTKSARTEVYWNAIDALVDEGKQLFVLTGQAGYSLPLPADLSEEGRADILAFAHSKLSDQALQMSQKLQRKV